MDVKQTEPDDTLSRIHNALVFEVEYENNSNLAVERIDLYIERYDGRILQKISQPEAPYCGFGSDGTKCTTYVFAEHNQLWPDGSSIKPMMVVLRAIAYSDNVPISATTQAIEIQQE